MGHGRLSNFMDQWTLNIKSVFLNYPLEASFKKFIKPRLNTSVRKMNGFCQPYSVKPWPIWKILILCSCIPSICLTFPHASENKLLFFIPTECYWYFYLCLYHCAIIICVSSFVTCFRVHLLRARALCYHSFFMYSFHLQDELYLKQWTFFKEFFWSIFDP